MVIKRKVTVYLKIEVLKLDKNMEGIKDYEPYKFKEFGYLVLYILNTETGKWQCNDFITVDDLKKLIGRKYNRLFHGEREFIIEQ